jgi:hypothetical protein
MASSVLTCFFLVLLLQLLSQGTADVTVLHVEVAQTREAIATAKATCTVAMPATETYAQEVAMAWDSGNLCIKGIED